MEAYKKCVDVVDVVGWAKQKVRQAKLYGLQSYAKKGSCIALNPKEQE